MSFRLQTICHSFLSFRWVDWYGIWPTWYSSQVTLTRGKVSKLTILGQIIRHSMCFNGKGNKMVLGSWFIHLSFDLYWVDSCWWKRISDMSTVVHILNFCVSGGGWIDVKCACQLRMEQKMGYSFFLRRALTFPVHILVYGRRRENTEIHFFFWKYDFCWPMVI